MKNIYDVYSFIPIVSPVSSSSPTSTQRIENGGSKCAKPNNGDFEQLVTNYETNRDIEINKTNITYNYHISHEIPSKISLFLPQKNLFLEYPIASTPHDDYRENHHNIVYVFVNLVNLVEHYHPKLISVTKNKDILKKYFFKKLISSFFCKNVYLTSGVENNANHSGLIIERNPLIKAAV